MIENKKFAVLIPSFNDELDKVIKTFSGLSVDFNILVVDDGSDIPFITLIGDKLDEFKKLNVIRLLKNSGIEKALEIGSNVLASEYEYIARLDIGDFSPNVRFEKQLLYLDNNPNCVLVGTWGRFVSTNGDELFISKLPTNDSIIRKKMYLNNMFIHPSVMMRSNTLQLCGGYRNKYQACEDYDLFFRLMKYGEVHNIAEPLIDYEVNFSSISSKKRKIQVFNRMKIIAFNFNFFQFGFYPYYGIMRSFFMLFVGRNLTNTFRTLLKK